MSERAVLLRIQGQVQGVGYRAFTGSEAKRLGVSGWVVNRDDGTVEAALRGEGAALAELIGRLRNGPSAARVDTIDVRSTDSGRVTETPEAANVF